MTLPKLSINWTSILIIATVAIAILYFISQGITGTGDATTFQLPSDSSNYLTVFKIMMLGGMILLLYAFGIKAGQTWTKRDWFTIIAILVVLVLAWTFVIQPIFGAQTLDQISFKLGAKLGVFHP